MTATPKNILLGIRYSRQFRVAPGSNVSIHDGVKCRKSKIKLSRGSSLTIEENVSIRDCAIAIGAGCNMRIAAGCSLEGAAVTIDNGSTVELGRGVIIKSTAASKGSLTIDNGTLSIADRARIVGAEVLVRFGGAMSIGKYSILAGGAEIRCEQQVTIGEYVLVSYDACIYDTNAHSTGWRERRERIETCYPDGIAEESKPETNPVTIGDDVWIGKGATVTKGCVLGKRCIVGIRTSVGGAVYGDDSVIVSQKPRVL
jgi:acetyltransferase-like isoleucine patch superfamily enzyme